MQKPISLLACASFIFMSSALWAEDLNYQVTAKKLDESRNNLSVKTGSSSFSFNQEDIANLPLGQATSLNQVLQRAPGVVVNSQNQIHVRGDHANLQYRINGVMLPEGVGGFGQALDTHFADSIELLTGAMPAQYGLRTAGVVDIKTKTGHFDKKNRSEITIGGNDTFGANQQVGGHSGNLDYYLSANYLQSARGIESTTAARNSSHNDTTQDNVFGYFSYMIEPTQRLSLIVSNSTNRFEIPNTPNQEKEFELSGATADADYIDQRQRESNRFAVVALQGVTESNIDYQLSLFTRYSDLQFKPDYQSDLVYNGISSSLDRSSFANGVQGDFSYELNEKNTLRAGFYISQDRVKSFSDNWVFTGTGHHDNFVQDSSNTPILINQTSAKNSSFYSAYLQNEWKALEKLTLNYGARFDISQAYVRESQISPRFGAVYDLSQKTKIHAGYSKYFTPPPVSSISKNQIDSFEGTSNEAEVDLNDKVRAERTNYYDIGISHKATPNLTLGLDGYYKDIKNALDEHQFGNSLIYTPFNYAKAKVYGLEFKADYQKGDFASYLNVAMQRARAKNIISGQYVVHEEEYEYAKNNFVRMDHAQDLTASMGASYVFLKTKYAADAIYGSGLSTGENNRHTMPSYWQFNASAARDIVLGNAGKVNVRLSVINLLDEVYQYSDGSGIGVSASQFAPRRTFYMILSKNF